MKSHFTFTKEQRNGIFLLIIIIIVLQCLYFYVDFSSDTVEINQDELIVYQKEIESLKRIQEQNNTPKLYPFNPNYITDFKGASLGMTNEEIDKLLNFRKQNKWINSATQFQEVTQISDSLLQVISPYFKFPERVTNATFSERKSTFNNQPKTYNQKTDLNTATDSQLQQVSGVGKVLSERIIKYRNTFKGGFIADVQLADVYGLTPETILKIKNDFTVKTPRLIKKIDLNRATVDELVTIQHIDYEVANNIIEYRLLHEGFKSVNELLKVKEFPANKIEIIELYLHLEKEN